MTDDEMREAARRYQAALPHTDFPALPASARGEDPTQSPAMHRAVARLWNTPAEPADTLAFEAQTYIATRQHACSHVWVTVDDHRRPPFRECPYCDRRER